MVKIDDILNEINIIHLATLRNPTHVMVCRSAADNLILQYKNLCLYNTDNVDNEDHLNIDLDSVSDFLGATILVGRIKCDEFKILEEVTSNS